MNSPGILEKFKQALNGVTDVEKLIFIAEEGFITGHIQQIKYDSGILYVNIETCEDINDSIAFIKHRKHKLETTGHY